MKDDHRLKCIYPEQLVTIVLNTTLGVEALSVGKTKSNIDISDQSKSFNVKVQPCDMLLSLNR